MSNYFENSEEKRINCEGGFGIIPFYLSIDKSIPDGAKLLFSDMWLAQLQKGYCCLSNSELAEIRNVSSRTITNWVSLLKEKGWIKTQYIITQQGEIKQRNIYLNPKPEINNIVEKISEADFVGYRNQLLGGTEASFQVYNIREEINNKILKNTKKEYPIEKNIPASGSLSSPKVDELRLAEEVFENSFWVLVPNKVGKEKAKKLFFRITNNCNSEKKVNEVVDGYKRYLSFLAKNKDNNFNRRPKDPATFLNFENKLWLEPWEYNEEEVVLSAGGSRVKQPKNWQDRIGIAKSLGLLNDFEPEEIREMYKEWKYIPREAKEAIASEEVDNKLKQIEEYRKAEKERKQKEEVEQKKEKIRLLIEKYEPKFQALRNELKFTFYTLEEVAKIEDVFFDTIYKIREYERKLEEKEAERKKQQELEQKKIVAENSKHNLDECERALWTYISQAVDVNTYLDRNKKRFPNSYETFKALFSNGETLLEVVFGKLAKDTVVDRLKNNILSFLINDMANEEARNLYNKRNDAWTKWNQLAKAML